MIAFLAGIVVGVLALILGDYIIILFTALSGAMLVVSMADRFYDMEEQLYNMVFGGLALLGVLLQCIHKWDRKNVKREKKRERRRD